MSTRHAFNLMRESARPAACVRLVGVEGPAAYPESVLEFYFLAPPEEHTHNSPLNLFTLRYFDH